MNRENKFLNTLLDNRINWPLFVGIAFVMRVVLIEISWLSYFSLILSLHHFFLFFEAIGTIIPTRYLLGVFMCLQFFIGPSLAYNGFDQYQFFLYKMRVPEEVYFGYAIPAVLCFILGLHLYANNLKSEYINEAAIKKYVQRKPQLPYYFVAFGFMSSFISQLFSSELAFVFYLIANFKFVGLYLLLLGSDKIKLLSLTLVMGSIISSSLVDGMFHDLLTWIIFTGAVFGIKYKFNTSIKLIGATIFICAVIIIQSLKGVYRTSSEKGFDTFTKLYESQNEKQGMFTFENLAPNVVRINQGFIITNIMYNVPDRVPFSNGEEMYQVLEAAIMPRIFAPNKLTAGNKALFTKYSGIKLSSSTSMGLSSIGDAYINFGVAGGCLFMFLLGLVYNGILNVFYKNSLEYPMLLLFIPLAFYYPIRPDCELQTILGHLFKSCMLIAAMVFIFKSFFRVAKNSVE